MILPYSVIIFISCIFCFNTAFATDCTFKIQSEHDAYELPRLWCFSTSDNLENRNIRNIEKAGKLFSPNDNWPDHPDYKEYRGNAWYGLTIYMPRATNDFAILLPRQSRGTQVYFNGELIYQTRPFDKNGATPEILGKPALVPVPKASIMEGKNSLVLRTGWLNNFGEYCYPILFGHFESIQLKWNLFIIRNSVLASIDMFLFIYFLIIFLNRRNEKYYFYFSLLALSLGLWIVGYDGIIFFLHDNQTSYVISTYVGSIVASLSYINFIAHFFNISEKERSVSYVLTVMHLALIPAIVLEMAVRGNIYYYQKYLYNLFMAIVVIVVLFCMYLCIRAVKEKQPYSTRILLGVSVYTTSFLLSIPIFLSLFTTVPFLILGFCIMTFIFASVLASRFAQVHNDLENLNSSLVEINHEKDRAIDKLNIYKYIVSESRDHMAFIDAGGRFVEANNALLLSYDKKRERVIGRTVKEIIGDEEYEASLKEHLDACLSGEWVVFEKWQEFPLIGRRYMITSLYPYGAGSGRSVGMVYYSIDITERIMFEQELVKIAENERNQIGIELHDNLAQKLFGIALKSSVLAGDLNGGQKEAALEIEGLINEAIAYIRNIAKSLTRIDFIDGGFASLLNELKSLMERRYNVTLGIDVDCDIDMVNRKYSSQIFYIMQEAVINSVKHSGANIVRIRVHRSGNDIHLLIKDDGVGIPDGADRGRGIGLKIMKYRARMIGSSISVQRGSEGGTEVLCVIPA